MARAGAEVSAGGSAATPIDPPGLRPLFHDRAHAHHDTAGPAEPRPRAEGGDRFADPVYQSLRAKRGYPAERNRPIMPSRSARTSSGRMK